MNGPSSAPDTKLGGEKFGVFCLPTSGPSYRIRLPFNLQDTEDTLWPSYQSNHQKYRTETHENGTAKVSGHRQLAIAVTMGRLLVKDKSRPFQIARDEVIVGQNIPRVP